MSRYDLLSLQGKAKRDPEGYRDDVLMQLQHYNALHGLFMLKPGKDFKAFADLTTFLAQVAKSYPRDMPEFHRPIIELLDTHYALLEPSLRRSLTSALILLHNRGACALGDLLPLFFKMFRCEDKPLRALVFAHVVAAVRRANKTKRDETLNRSVQNFLRSALMDENVAAAKKALAVLTELYRRNVWNDARTVNLVAEATKHASPKILVAALKFFLGQDEAAEAAAEAGDEDSDNDEDTPKTGAGTKAGTSSGVSKEDVYRAYNKGEKKKKRFFRFFLVFFLGSTPIAACARARADRFSSPGSPPATSSSRRPMMHRYICYSRGFCDDTQSPRSLRPRSTCTLPRRAFRFFFHPFSFFRVVFFSRASSRRGSSRLTLCLFLGRRRTYCSPFHPKKKTQA